MTASNNFTLPHGRPPVITQHRFTYSPFFDEHIVEYLLAIIDTNKKEVIAAPLVFEECQKAIRDFSFSNSLIMMTPKGKAWILSGRNAISITLPDKSVINISKRVNVEHINTVELSRINTVELSRKGKWDL